MMYMTRWIEFSFPSDIISIWQVLSSYIEASYVVLEKDPSSSPKPQMIDLMTRSGAILNEE